MSDPISILGTSNSGFLPLVVIGGLAGWVAGTITGTQRRLFTNVVIGVAGSWLGSWIAGLLGFVVDGSIGHFVAALVGSIIIIAIWRRLYPETSRPEIEGARALR